MANILISYYSDYGEAMYDAISEVLYKNGNNVFRMNINNPEVSITSWGGNSKINSRNLLEEIKGFNLGIVLNFNNSLPWNCYKILDKNCKICIIDADAPSLAFWNKDIFKEYADNLLFLGLQSYSKTMYENFLNKKLTNKNYLYFPPATVGRNQDLKQNKNISFIGSNFYPYKIPQGQDFYDPKKALKLYEYLKKDFFVDENFVSTFIPNVQNPYWLLENVRSFYAGQERIKYMQQLTDLGLCIFGKRYWEKIAYVDMDIANCHKDEDIVTLEDNMNVYNTSKISVNFSHPLAKSSFSWRVMDIMASNSCLLMEDKPDWHDLFDRYLSEDVLNSVVYKDRFDMRQKAIKLLENEKLRQKCVAELNEAIEKNGRWEIRFETLEKFLGIKLLKIKNKTPEYIVLKKEESKKTSQTTQKNMKAQRPFLHGLRLKNRYKLVHYLIVALIVQMPFVNLLICSKKRANILNKIQKWWR